MNGKLVLGDFQLRAIERIGKGGFGQVILSRCVCGTFRCVKRVNARKPKVRKMIEDEILITSKLNHPNITRFCRSFEHAGTMNIVMEYVSNITMRTIINVRRDTGYIRSNTLMTYFVDILMGLEYLRTKSIIHRDIKPENLLISRKGHVKIADFGLSVFHKPEKPYYGGTVHYMSLECLNNQTMDYQSDIWSLGCVLYELCTGAHPLGEVRRKHQVRLKICNYCDPYFKVDCFDMPEGDLWADLCECMLTCDIKYRISIQELLEHDARISSEYRLQYNKKSEVPRHCH